MSEKHKWLNELNDPQREAVCYGDGPLLVVAGAGSGKTRTLAYRVAYLIAEGVDPNRILLLSFTRRAAEEMLRRAEGIIREGTGSAARVWGGTFHSISNRLLRIYGQAAGISSDFTILDQADAEDLMDVVRHEMGLHSREKRFPRKRTCLAIYSRCVNGNQELTEVLSRYYPWCAAWESELKAMFRAYVVRKQERNVLDYDDLLLYLSQLLSNPSAARQIGGKFDHVLVDEYQDTNKVQAEILLGLRRHNKNLMVVGDDAQSIYSFRAAAVENILDFPKIFPGVTIVKLEQNYRSVRPILETTNRVIAQARNRYTKDLWSVREGGERPQLVTCNDESSQDRFIVERVLEHFEQGIPLQRQAVLFRASYHSNSLEVELSSRNIPFHKYGGLRFLEASHIKDLIAFLRVLENPKDDVAWFRILQLVEGVGPSTASKIVRQMAGQGYSSEALQKMKVPRASEKEMTSLSRALADLSGSEGKSPAVEVERIRRTYKHFLEKLYENPSARAKDLENLEQIASRYRSRRNFLVDLQLDPPTSTSDLAGAASKDEDWLVLSTIHSAKGCEWDVVYLIHAADGCLPSDMSTGSREEIEEELRLTYVAMTRARNFLYVTWPIRYYHRWYGLSDRHSYAQLSRFLNEDVRSTMDSISIRPEEPEDQPEEVDLGDDIRSRLRSMWD